MGSKVMTAINCMDGRVQLPVIRYLKKKFKIEYVDMITDAGPNKILSQSPLGAVSKRLFDKIRISIDKHGSKRVAICAHHDCAGNPVSKEKQIADLIKSAETFTAQFPHISVLLLWVNSQWAVEAVDPS